MNKDVIYIEPEDDITDILAKIKNSENKIVALVPPKKAGVLQSSVNFKLIHKTALKVEKTVVLVSSDESLMRLAAAVDMPVAKNLQSKPQILSAEALAESEPVAAKAKEVSAGETIELEEIQPEEEPEAKADKKAAAKSEKKPKTDNKTTVVKKRKSPADKTGFDKYKKQVIAGVIIALGLTGFSIWAIVIAPAVSITLSISTNAKNFAESVTFTTKESEADPENGIFYMEGKEVTKTAKSEFEATGELDKGSKASGTIVVKRGSFVKRYTFMEAAKLDYTSKLTTISVPSGTKVTCSGKEYVVEEGASASQNILDTAEYDKESKTLVMEVKSSQTGQLKVSAAENGDKYNIDATTCTSASLSEGGYTITSSAMTGGSSKIAKIVSEDDIADAERRLEGQNSAEVREELSSEFDSDYILINNSFASDESKVTVSPALGEEVLDDVTPQIIKETKYRIYAVKRADLDQYLATYAERNFVGEDTSRRVYDTGIASAFIDGFRETDGGKYTGKFKSSVKLGPVVSEESILNDVLGKKVGKVQADLRSVPGIKDAKVDAYPFWVTSVPNKAEKVEITINYENAE